ncbi:MAG: Xaa-Pro aminopeptidase [Bacteriovoracaceae bacterium]|jgi:Xaa-Pro aminopeptidase
MNGLDIQKITQIIGNLRHFIKDQGLTSLYIPSFDLYLSEYVPLEDCPRYFVTGFTGSVAEVLLTTDKNYLFVDGRYHEHAALECDPEIVDVVPCPYGVSNFDALIEKAMAAGGTLGIFSSRTPYNSYKILKSKMKLKLFNETTIDSLFNFPGNSTTGTIRRIPESISGQSTCEKLEELINGGQACFVSATDSIAWLSNCRGYQFPYMASFKAKALGIGNELHLFVPSKDKVSKELLQVKELHFHLLSNLEKVLTEKLSKVEEIIVDPLSINTQDHRFLKGLLEEEVREKDNFVVKKQSLKNSSEMKHIEESFHKSNQVIFNTLSWLKSRVKKKDKVTEFDFFNKTNSNYKEAGALGNSFNTIAGSGANSSIIHYKTPSPQKNIVEGELVLLDSGGYYEGGYATDTTRTIISGGEASAEHKKMFTLVLKGFLKAMNAEFPEGTLGKEIDALARAPLKEAGYDYSHGTGHGIGVHVHEGGYSITPTSEVELREGSHGSIEPGLYFPGVGGVRIENTVFVEAHPEKEKTLRFKNLVWIGMDPLLIDLDLLDQEEKSLLKEYEIKCSEKGLSFGADKLAL